MSDPMDLFESPESRPTNGPDGRAGTGEDEVSRPLADRVRPERLEEFVGQEEILGEGRVLRRIIEADEPTSILLWGPPGCGKTTLARVIANRTGAHFIPFSAVLGGVKELREMIEAARKVRRAQNRRTVLFVDEIHRFNKAQQDAFLPHRG